MSETPTKPLSKLKILWLPAVIFGTYHLLALQGFYYFLTFQIKWQTVLWTFILYFFCMQGIAIGSHRLWAHRSFKARLPLRIYLCFWHSVSFQHHLYQFARDHRTHHKFVDTNADPYNAQRGFWFSHIGWLISQKHPDVVEKGRTVDISDVKADPVVMFQKKYHWYIGPFLAWVFPALVPIYCWGESEGPAWCFAAMLRYVGTLNAVFFVNSLAHKYGMRPYIKDISPAENWWTSFFTFGEGWHNYHHAFPNDYRGAEMDKYFGNFNTWFIEIMEKIGQAYDLKKPSDEVVKMRALRTGS